MSGDEQVLHGRPAAEADTGKKLKFLSVVGSHERTTTSALGGRQPTGAGAATSASTYTRVYTGKRGAAYPWMQTHKSCNKISMAAIGAVSEWALLGFSAMARHVLCL